MSPLSFAASENAPSSLPVSLPQRNLLKYASSAGRQLRDFLEAGGG